MILAALLVEIVLLFLLSRGLVHSFYKLFILIFRARTLAVSLTTLLLFPGTVIHELAHLFTAEVLGVPTGKLTLAPESIRGEKIQTGSVAIARTDPFRRYAIGLAPVFVGLLILAAISYWLPTLLPEIVVNFPNERLLFSPNTYLVLGLMYLLFAISNSMFSSAQDLKGFLPFAVVLSLFAAAGYFAGIRIGLTAGTLNLVYRIIEGLTRSLLWVLAVNVILLLIVNLLIAAAAKIFNRRVSFH